MIRVLSKEIYFQDKFQNRALFKVKFLLTPQEYIEIKPSKNTVKRKREGRYHCEVTDEFLIVSDGFDYDFYSIELTHSIHSNTSIFKEVNLAFRDKLLDYNEFPH